jgi:1-carboxybiuret hydrolase subunit AtzG-like protein
MARKAKPTKKRIPLSVKRRSRLKNKADALDGFIAAAGKVLDLPAQKTWLPAIKANLLVTLRHAQSVGQFELPGGGEPAPVFKV